ncbi:MAG: Nif3-like dinuclear metal center hexameric protein [Paludibacteraceae bacterium]|nr:Nif3-like dinuclear metal center hexameric protein [Paludibacteraceae bacterium]
MLLRAIINSIESVAPRSAQCEWDNSGMQVGDTERDIESVLLATDITEAVVNESIVCGCQLIVSHHPLLFRGLKQVCGQTPQARVVEQAIRHNIAIYSAHTSLDSVVGGVNTKLAELLGIENSRILVPNDSDSRFGLGVIGRLAEPMSYEAFIGRVKETLKTTYVRYTEPAKAQVQTIALCGGAGAEFIETAIEQGADVYLTADCKYHEMQDAAGRIGLVDIDHWVSECHARVILKNIIEPLGVKCIISKADQTPVRVLI